MANAELQRRNFPRQGATYEAGCDWMCKLGTLAMIYPNEVYAKYWYHYSNQRMLNQDPTIFRMDLSGEDNKI